MKIKISELNRNYQTRVAINEETLAEYVQAMEEGASFPPVSVVSMDGAYALTDGYHRVEAAIRRGMGEIEAVVTEGTHADALKAALAANACHGLRRGNADKRRALEVAWENREVLFDKMLGQDENGKPNGLPSKRQLAAITGVSNELARVFIEETRVAETATHTPDDWEEPTPPAAVSSSGASCHGGACDRFGVVIPERILPAFKSKALSEQLRIIGKSRQAMNSLRLEDASCMAIDENTMIRYDNLIRQMRMSAVYCVCRACGGMGCYRCSKRGFQTKAQYSMNPPELKFQKSAGEDDLPF